MSKEIVIYHSPDADDAFMFHGMVSGAVSVPGYTFKSELSDIETLNQKAKHGEIDATAVSVHAFSLFSDQYAIVNHGASMGEKSYGPRLVCRTSESPLTTWRTRKLKMALPGELTSATLALKLFLKEQGLEVELQQMHFEAIESTVLNGDVDAGLLIHEGQLTHQELGLHTALDLGAWWWEKTEMPLPLGVNIVKKSLPLEDQKAIASILKRSIKYSLEHRDEALDYALSFGRGLPREKADKFVGMYVNDRTLDLGVDGRASIQMFLNCGGEAGFCPVVGDISYISGE